MVLEVDAVGAGGDAKALAVGNLCDEVVGVVGAIFDEYPGVPLLRDVEGMEYEGIGGIAAAGAEKEEEGQGQRTSQEQRHPKYY